MDIKLPPRPRVANEAQARAILAKVKARDVQKNKTLFDKTAVELTPERVEFYLSKCHAKQREMLLNRSRFKALLCPRRTGKTTYTLFETMLHAERHPGSTIAYIVPDSKGHARRLFWRPLKKMNEALGLGLIFHETDKRVETPWGTDILLFAAHDKDSPAALRGDAYSLVLLDECKDFGAHFEELLVEAVLPGLGDYGGTLVLAGTPGSVLNGIFYRVTTGQYSQFESQPVADADEAKGPNLNELADETAWFVARWIKSDNEFLPAAERDLDRVWRSSYRILGLSKDSPKFRREQLAEWCTDDTERVYLYDQVRNGWEGMLPEGPHEWLYCLGVDLGERDANAFVVGAFAKTCRNLFIVDQYAKPGMSIDEIAEKIRDYERKYGSFVFMVADTGGYGRGIVTDLQNRHGIPVEAADKGKNKLGNIQQMNSDFLSGRIRCNKDTPLAAEWLRLVKKIRPTDLKVILDHTDLGDAALYMWKASLHWASAEVEIEPLPGTSEFWKKYELDAIKKESERCRDRINGTTRAPSERGNF